MQYINLFNMDLKNLLFYSFLISSVVLSLCIETMITKITYNKPLLHLNDKSYNRTNIKYIAIGMQTTESTFTILPTEDKAKPTSPHQKLLSQVTAVSDSVQSNSEEGNTTETNTKTISSTPSDNTSCVCGIFLGSQFIKGSSEPPKGDPVISTTVQRTFACSPLGQKQCQTKCLEQILQHLPNSAKILCASLGRDIRKERAFLFVRNCGNKWHNTKLTAGREYCCKNGLPYNCPKN